MSVTAAVLTRQLFGTFCVQIDTESRLLGNDRHHLMLLWCFWCHEASIMTCLSCCPTIMWYSCWVGVDDVSTAVAGNAGVVRGGVSCQCQEWGHHVGAV